MRTSVSIEIKVVFDDTIDWWYSLSQWSSSKLLTTIPLGVTWVLCVFIVALDLTYWVLNFWLIVCHICCSIIRYTLYFSRLAFIKFIYSVIVLRLIIQCRKYVIWITDRIESRRLLFSCKWILLSKNSRISSLKYTS